MREVYIKMGRLPSYLLREEHTVCCFCVNRMLTKKKSIMVNKTTTSGYLFRRYGKNGD